MVPQQFIGVLRHALRHYTGKNVGIFKLVVSTPTAKATNLISRQILGYTVCVVGHVVVWLLDGAS